MVVAEARKRTWCAKITCGPQKPRDARCVPFESTGLVDHAGVVLIFG
jgi:hypothetical protein